MNFKKPKMENLTGALVTGGAAGAGAAASNLLVAELTKKPSGDEKKDKSKRQLVKGGAVAAALLGLACVDGNDTSANALRGAFVGMAGAQGISLAREFTSATAGTTVKRALGLGCPCQEQQEGLGYVDQPEWFTPVYDQVDYSAYDSTSQAQESTQGRNPLAGFTPRESYV